MCRPVGIGIGHDDIRIVCEKSGKRITHSDVYGTWCDDECDRDKSVEHTVLKPDGSLDHEKTLKAIRKAILGVDDVE